MRTRFYIDPATGLPHVYGHSIDEQEVRDILETPVEDRPGQEGARVAVGQTSAGRYLRGKATKGIQAKKTESSPMKSKNFPAGWDEDRVKRLLAHYDEQTEEEAVAEDEAAFGDENDVVMGIPRDLVPLVRELIAKHQQ
jgi:hypothetical protein